MRATVRELVLLGVGLFVAGLVCILAYAVVPQFQRMFAPYESELSLQTRLLFATYRWWPLLPLAVAVTWLLASSPRRAAHSSLWVGVSGGAVLTAFGWWALHQPRLMLRLIGG